MLQNSNTFANEYANMTRAGEITETVGFGYLIGKLQQERLGFTRIWELAHDFIS